MNITTTTLDELQYPASLCLKCGGCTYSDWPENHRLCSIYWPDQCFTHSGGGFMALVAAVPSSLLPYDEKIASLAYTCAGCLTCDSRCSIIRNHPPKVEIIDMIRALRHEAVTKGLVPKDVLKQLEHIKGGGKGKSSLNLPEAIKRDDADTVIFAGCAHTESEKDISAALGRVLGKVGVPVTAFAETGCCGSSLYDYGLWDELLPVMEANWKKMKSLAGKTFVFTNPHCEEFITKRYPENIPECSDVQHRHISQFLTQAIKNGKLAGKKNGKIKVTYHDPCYLGRGLDIYDAPRDVLASLKGVELVEMTRNRKNSLCCGARALGSYFPNHREKMAKERIGEFEATGADLLITACPYCRENFRKVLPAAKKGLVKDLVEFVDERTG